MQADVHSASEDKADVFRYAAGIRHRGGGSGVHGATGMEGAATGAEGGVQVGLRLRALTANCGTANGETANCGSLNASSHYIRSLEARKPRLQVLQLGLLISRLPCMQASGAKAIAVGSFAVGCRGLPFTYPRSTNNISAHASSAAANTRRACSTHLRHSAN